MDVDAEDFFVRGAVEDGDDTRLGRWRREPKVA